MSRHPSHAVIVALAGCTGPSETVTEADATTVDAGPPDIGAFAR